MPKHLARIGATHAAVFAAGVVVGAWLTRPREAPILSAYDREVVEDMQERAKGLRWRVEQAKRKQG